MRRFISYAKFNLYLAVGRRRSDGYHEIDTVLQTIDLADELSFEPLESGHLDVICPDPAVPGGPENLVHRALELLRDRSGVEEGMRVVITKRIPPEAGLGGGSSNAACALAAGSLIWGLGLRADELEAMAADIGSDVPFFIRGGTQRCRGRGEICERLEPLPDSVWVVVKPAGGLSTTEVYGLFRSPLTQNRQEVRMILESVAKRDLPTVVEMGFNDLEGPASEIQPTVARLTAWMRTAGLTGSRLAGSGSAWVGLVSDPEAVRRAELDGFPSGWRVFRVRSTDRGWIEQETSASESHGKVNPDGGLE